MVCGERVESMPVPLSPNKSVIEARDGTCNAGQASIRTDTRPWMDLWEEERLEGRRRGRDPGLAVSGPSAWVLYSSHTDGR